jgi:perosamine synthetase
MAVSNDARNIIMGLHHQLKYLTSILIQRRYYGFVGGHDYLSKNEIFTLKRLINNPSKKYVECYENDLANSLGGGFVKTYASGRMAFFSILKAMKIQAGSEVILTGLTCSVMVNAVKRAGLKPVFSDIDVQTYGSSPEEISHCITSSTRVIVAQHSFGIPCKIDEIKHIADKNGILLIEDCALSFLSKYKKRNLGTWGDFAIFSSDHTKPLNTFIGGFLYTKSQALFNSINKSNTQIEEISKTNQHLILKQLLRERKYYHPQRYKILLILQYINSAKFKFFPKLKRQFYLNDDNGPYIQKNKSYPYPALLPSFLAYLGSLDLKNYLLSIEPKRAFLAALLRNKYPETIIPTAYYDKDCYIVPLRFILYTSSHSVYRHITKFIDQSWFWFKRPIVSTTEQLQEYGYISGSCPISEEIGKYIINIPLIHYNDSSLLKIMSDVRELNV